MKDVCQDQKQQPRWNHGETTIERVDQAKVIPQHEARGTKQKQ